MIFNMYGFNEKVSKKSVPNRIIKFFQEHPQYDYTVAELARELEINHKIIKAVIQEMERENKIVQVRLIAYRHTYQLKEWMTESRQKEREMWV